MFVFPHRVGARFVALLRADPSGVRAGFVALLISTGTGLVAGLTLGSITGTLEELPGLMILVPAAVGMRGNVFGALGSRLGTAVHTGTFRWSWRIDTLVGQNLASAVALSMALAFLLAIVAKGFAVAFGVSHSISIADFIVVSVIGGLIPIVVVMGITHRRRRAQRAQRLGPRQRRRAGRHRGRRLGHAAEPVPRDRARRGPRGDAGARGPLRASLCLVCLVAGWRTHLTVLRRIVRESVPVLVAAGRDQHARRPHDRRPARRRCSRCPRCSS